MPAISTVLRRVADGYATGSVSNRMRERRFELFGRLVGTLPRPLRIVDIGGTQAFWEHRGWTARDDVEIMLVNRVAPPSRHGNVHSTVGDATDLRDLADGEFDVAFSNSVIEHLFTPEAQRAMARETMRVARAYWVQTPSFWFPLEPHFLVPGWQWLPEAVRVAAIRRRELGWRGPCPDPDEARRTVREIRLLRGSELRRLFPDATIRRERVGPLTKSFVAYGGFSELRAADVPVGGPDPRRPARAIT